jgi:hypothetical protein
LYSIDYQWPEFTFSQRKLTKLAGYDILADNRAFLSLRCPAYNPKIKMKKLTIFPFLLWTILFLPGCNTDGINDKTKRNLHWAWWIEPSGATIWLSDH